MNRPVTRLIRCPIGCPVGSSSALRSPWWLAAKCLGFATTLCPNMEEIR